MILMMILSVFISLLIPVGIGVLIYTLIKKKNMNEENKVENKSKAVDFFLYFGIIISLIVCITNILEMIFTAIDRKFPDVLGSISYYSDAYNNDVRLAIASLIVMYPLYIILSFVVAKDISKNPQKKDIGVRKFMIYTALFVTVCTLVGTLVSIIYQYLGGELSTRFQYKAISVIIVSASVFAYYLYSLKRDYSIKTNVPLIATVVVSLFVIFSVVWSVSIIGSPKEMRAKKLDSTRLSDISRIQQEVLNKVNSTDKLPVSLSEIENVFNGYAVPVDPVTKEMYSYRVFQQPTVSFNPVLNRKELKTPGTFEICATFETERKIDARGLNQNGIKQGFGDPMPTDFGVSEMFYSASSYYYEGDQSPFWNHGIGYTCFKRIITSEMYYGR